MTERQGTEKRGDGTDGGQRNRMTTDRGREGEQKQRDREGGLERTTGDRVTR